MNGAADPAFAAALARIRARHQPVFAVGGRFDGEDWQIMLLLGEGESRLLPVAAARRLAADIVAMADVLEHGFEPAREPEGAA